MGAELTVIGIVAAFAIAITMGAMFDRYVLGRRYD